MPSSTAPEVPDWAKESGKENWLPNDKQAQRAASYKEWNDKFGENEDIKKEAEYPTSDKIKFKVDLIDQWDNSDRKKTNTTLYTILKENFAANPDITGGGRYKAGRLAFLSTMHMARQRANIDSLPKGGGIDVVNNRMTIKDSAGNVWNGFQNVEVLPMWEEKETPPPPEKPEEVLQQLQGGDFVYDQVPLKGGSLEVKMTQGKIYIKDGANGILTFEPVSKDELKLLDTKGGELGRWTRRNDAKIPGNYQKFDFVDIFDVLKDLAKKAIAYRDVADWGSL